jgi:hypothetical protein
MIIMVAYTVGWPAEESGLISGKGEKFLSSPNRLVRLWDLTASYTMGTERGKAAGE